MANAVDVHWREASRTDRGAEEDQGIMDRTDGLLIGGVALVAGSLRRLEDDAVDMTRRDIGLRARRTVGRSRRLARDVLALIQLAIGATILVRGLRTALREWSSVDDLEGVPVGMDTDPVAGGAYATRV